MCEWHPLSIASDMDHPVLGGRPGQRVVRENDRDGSLSEGIRLRVIPVGVVATRTAVRVDLGEPREPVGAKVAARLAHRLGRHVVVAGVKIGIGDGDSCHDPNRVIADAVEVRDAFDVRRHPGKLVQKLPPEGFRNQNHRSVLCSWGRAVPGRSG